MSQEFLVGLWDRMEAFCSHCKSHQPMTTGWVSTHLLGPGCKTCHRMYEWEDGRPMLVFPSNFFKMWRRMKDVYQERLLEGTHDCTA